MRDLFFIDITIRKIFSLKNRRRHHKTRGKMRQIHTAAFTLYKTSLAEEMRSNRTPRYTTAVPHNKKQQTREKRHTSRARQYICCVIQPPCPAEGYRGKKRSARHVTKRRKQRIKTHFSKCLTLQKNDLFEPRLCRSRCSAQ